LDQYQPNGTYVSTIMIPDLETPALLVCGNGPDAVYEATLNLSTNRYYLDIGGYNTNYPYIGVGYVNSNSVHSRMTSAINGLGYYAECTGPGTTLGNGDGDYTGGREYLRCIYSADGLLEF
jgi:hypothetical protein